MKITSFFSIFFTTEYTEYHGVFFLVLIIQIEANNDKTIGLRGNRIPLSVTPVTPVTLVF